ncbi:MAG TPA: hemerythrin family protein [Bacillota bacterium]|nr:hemerythrin family protein [Clostridiales bacterium]HOQ13821.1 hemerythrin family protein [Bacillota bacterium]
MLWKEKYELGVEQVDNQHRELFRRVDTFLHTLRSSTSWDERVRKVNETLDFMNGYVIEHFRDEEEYQKKIGYPRYEEHKKIHADMLNYVVHVTKEYKDKGYNEQLIQQFAGRLLAWLINHVAAEDQLIGVYAKEKGVGTNG